MDYLKLFQNHSEYETFVSSGTMARPNVSHCVNENGVHYNGVETERDYSKDYLTIESLEDNNTIYLKAKTTDAIKTVSASTDNSVTWTEYTSSTSSSGTTLATLNTGDKLLIKGENNTYATLLSTGNHNRFITTGQFEVKGNIMSLVSGDSFENADELTSNNTLAGLFAACDKLTSAEHLILPAKTLTEFCYHNMFANCTGLTTAPELPATTLANGCYSYMFYNCANLTTASIVPNVVKPVSGDYCCGMYVDSNVPPSSDYDSAVYEGCEEEEEE